MVDFSTFLEKKIEKKIDPISIYDTLDKKSNIGPLRPSQITILTDWFKLKESKDTIIKLQTGQGKTLIGLLILLSNLNAKNGPCIYLCPNNYLVSQTLKQATIFGIKAVGLENRKLPLSFINSESILVTNTYKLFNGKSIFGVNDASNSIDIGTILLDDTHKSLEIIKDSFTVKIPRVQNKQKNPLFHELIKLFENDLLKQAPGTLLDIKNNQSSDILAIPYWNWLNKSDQVLKILLNNKDQPELIFTWELVKNKLKDTICIISRDKIEITPIILPINSFPSYANAKRRLFMSATLSEDAFLLKDLQIDLAAIKNPISDKDLKYSGERLIVVPRLINSEINAKNIRKILVKKVLKEQKFGMVVLVPSFNWGNQFWGEIKGIKILTTDTIEKTINKISTNLESSHLSSIPLLANRYDGIDLPDNTCRILVLDGSPESISLFDKYESASLSNSEQVNRKIAQRIEQGFGRAVRGPNDYCLVIVLGQNLVNQISQKRKLKYFSKEIQMQIEIGQDITEKMKETYSVDNFNKEFRLLIDQILIKRDEGWKSYYNDKMNKITLESSSKLLEIFQIELKSHLEFSNNNIQKAIAYVDNIINSDLHFNDSNVIGWYEQLKARYYYFIDKERMLKVQQSAFKKNNNLFKPSEGLVYERIKANTNQCKNIINFITGFGNLNALKIHVEEILSGLEFESKYTEFEKCVNEFGEILGFESQRPDKMWGQGPDNLWNLDGSHYWVIECKNEVTGERGISKLEIGQMHNSSSWFENKYANTTYLSLFIHPSDYLDINASTTGSIRVLNEINLNNLKIAVDNFYTSIVQNKNYSEEFISKSLINQNLDVRNITSYIKQVQKQK